MLDGINGISHLCNRICSSMNKTYTIQNHIHNFAIWTAARASQRDFAKTKYIQAAIASTDLKAFAEGKLPQIKQAMEFDQFHKKTCQAIIDFFKTHNLPHCSYGRAAKIVAIYLKTAVIMPSRGEGNLASIIHPPIDSILLNNLHQEPEYKKLRLNERSWTKLEKEEYWDLWEQLKTIQKEPYWALERFWAAT